ncbi:MAG: hypothetical protein ACI814_000584 [Mariniblastus sp.]|jgi:hypothetical protein
MAAGLRDGRLKPLAAERNWPAALFECGPVKRKVCLAFDLRDSSHYSSSGLRIRQFLTSDEC